MSLASLTFPFLLLRSKGVPDAAASAAPPSPSPPPIAGIHHLKFPVSNLDASLKWYTSVMSASHILSLDHYTSSGKRYAAVLSLPALGETKLELRLDYGKALQARGTDPMTLAVTTRADLERWAEWLDAKKVRRSGILKGTVGWVLVLEDPNGRFIRLYTEQTHDMTAEVDRDDYWLGSAET
ncbi:hypothetical protein MMC30_002804 [Trapelia coarctata]|nr:hypothetical protein [Trapelia coarctata]